VVESVAPSRKESKKYSYDLGTDNANELVSGTSYPRRETSRVNQLRACYGENSEKGNI
jgi:hypothetical protein